MDLKKEEKCSSCETSHEGSLGSQSGYSDDESYFEIESNLEWIKEYCDKRGNLFYLQALQREPLNYLDDTYEASSTKHGSEKLTSNRKLQKVRSSYSKLRHWMIGEKKVKSSLKESPKSNWLKKGIKSLSSSSAIGTSSSLSSSSAKKVPLKDNSEVNESNKFSKTPKIGIERELSLTGNILLNLIRDGITEKSEEHQEKIFTLMYLASPNDNSSNDKDYAVLIYPPNQSTSTSTAITTTTSSNENSGDNKDNVHFANGSGLNNWQKLIKLKGMFVSLSQVINDITGQLPIFSKVDVRGKLESLTTKREDNVKSFKSDDKTFIVTYAQEYNSALVLCFPEDNFNETEVISIISSMSRFFRFMYNSLDAAFKNTENHVKIYHYLNIFHYLLSESNLKGPSLCYNFDMIQRLVIEDDLLLGLDEALSEFESMDWLSDHAFGENGEISSSCDLLVIGSALFYKGYLISSHLSGTYLSDIVAYLTYRGIVRLINHSPIKLVVWQEVFPSSEKSDPMVTDFHEADGTRFFLLVVAVEQTLLTLLMEMPFLTSELETKPNEMIINQALRFVASTLNRSGLIQELNQHLNAQSYIFANTWSTDSGGNRLRQSTSARDIAGIGRLRDDETSSYEDDQWSDHSSLPSNLNKSLSSPSLPQIQAHNQQQQKLGLPVATITEPTTTKATLSSVSASSLEKGSSSQHNELTIETTSCSQSIPSCLDFYYQDLCFPEYLLFYVDMDLNSRTFYGPVITDTSKFALPPNLAKNLRNAAIYLSEKINKYYPGINEMGNHFVFRETFLSPSIRLKAKKSSETELNLWVVGRKETPDREIYLFFRVPTKGRKSVSFLPTEPLFHRLLMQTK